MEKFRRRRKNTMYDFGIVKFYETTDGNKFVKRTDAIEHEKSKIRKAKFDLMQIKKRMIFEKENEILKIILQERFKTHSVYGDDLIKFIEFIVTNKENIKKCINESKREIKNMKRMEKNIQETNDYNIHS